MIITCPWCGSRDAAEFTYHGDGGIRRPSLSETDMEAFEAYVYDRENPAGPHKELWLHSHGCRSHVLVTRNTLTHEVIACEAVGPWAAGGGRVKK
jgi:sarcosine oxidase subunit delta